MKNKFAGKGKYLYRGMVEKVKPVSFTFIWVEFTSILWLFSTHSLLALSDDSLISFVILRSHGKSIQ